MEGYCVKCRKKTVMKNAKQILTKNGKKAMKGQCSKCGTNMIRFI